MDFGKTIKKFISDFQDTPWFSMAGEGLPQNHSVLVQERPKSWAHAHRHISEIKFTNFLTSTRNEIEVAIERKLFSNRPSKQELREIDKLRKTIIDSGACVLSNFSKNAKAPPEIVDGYLPTLEWILLVSGMSRCVPCGTEAEVAYADMLDFLKSGYCFCGPSEKFGVRKYIVY